jgi:hypothetical protein
MPSYRAGRKSTLGKCIQLNHDVNIYIVLVMGRMFNISASRHQ